MRTAFSVAWKLLVAVWVVGAVGLLLAFRSFSMPSASMVPTLRTGDYMAVSMTAYGISKFSLPGRFDMFEGRLFAHDPARGDVIVFALPRDPSTSYVKRVIGLPGDTIQMKAGRLYINGEIVARKPVAKVLTEDEQGHENEVPTYRETLPGGRSYEIVEIQDDKGFNDNTEPFKVPAGKFFALGDNRDNSTDSRIAADQGGVGFVPFDNLIGRVVLVFLSAPRNGSVSTPMRRIQ